MIKIKKLKSNSHLYSYINNKLPKYKCSQSAIEFLVLTGFLLFSFTVFFLVIEGNMSDKIKERQDLAIKSVAIAVQEEIDLAFQSSDGYYRQFNIPENINGEEYEINITERAVYLRTNDGKYAIALPVKNVTGDVVKQPEINTIRKENGEVKLNIN
ncbi:MAG: hypothetical protein PHH54_01410 [Candidatus Nanoarchaeia archaeon]|nr:hypothetical protein [Candidatus Nanoarchaeia archaeon]MDD5740621.1 hypothetical protein [Candidatus Nanoarchaeia archaeon]